MHNYGSYMSVTTNFNDLHHRPAKWGDPRWDGPPSILGSWVSGSKGRLSPCRSMLEIFYLKTYLAWGSLWRPLFMDHLICLAGSMRWSSLNFGSMSEWFRRGGGRGSLPLPTFDLHGLTKSLNVQGFWIIFFSTYRFWFREKSRDPVASFRCNTQNFQSLTSYAIISRKKAIQNLL
jgi:hypothetical protein